MGDDIGLGLSSMVICFDFRSTNVVQLSNRNPHFYWFRSYHPLITQLKFCQIVLSLLKRLVQCCIVIRILGRKKQMTKIILTLKAVNFN